MKGKLFQNIKSMDRCNRTSLILVIICSVLLIAMTVMNICQIVDYNKNRNSGNERWHMLDDYMKSYEVRLQELEKKVNIQDYNK